MENNYNLTKNPSDCNLSINHDDGSSIDSENNYRDYVANSIGDFEFEAIDPHTEIRNNDGESNTTVGAMSVRDMIKMYNNVAAESKQYPRPAKRLGSGNTSNAEKTTKGFYLNDNSIDDCPRPSEFFSNINRNYQNRTSSPSTTRSDYSYGTIASKSNDVDINNMTYSCENNISAKIGQFTSNECHQTVEGLYKSKTTIAKTTQGIRITTDLTLDTSMEP